MKKLFVAYCLLSSTLTFAQDPATKNCIDIVYLKDGSKLVGNIKELKVGEYLIIQSIKGLEVKIEAKYMKKFVQDCKQDKEDNFENSYLEKGLYGSVRSHTLSGSTYWNDFTIGVGSQVGVGYRVNKFLGLGLSVGVEKMVINNEDDVATYPLMMEVSGMISNRKLSPTYNLGFGYGFANKNDQYQSYNRTINDQVGGLAYHGFLGLRLSNEIKLNIGARFQHKKTSWNYTWGELPYINEDKIVNKRLIIGIEYIW